MKAGGIVADLLGYRAAIWLIAALTAISGVVAGRFLPPPASTVRR